jgi:hypothetical protein
MLKGSPAVRIARSRGAKTGDPTPVRQIHLSLHRFINAHLPHVTGHANNRQPGACFRITYLETLADRVFAGPILPAIVR